MNLNEFGALIKALRNKNLNASLESTITQANLAKVLSLAPSRISELENGKRQTPLNEDELQKLAKYFKFTSRERYEFFKAAKGLEEQSITYDKKDPRELLENLINQVSSIQLPSFLMDTFFDVIALNSKMMALFNIDDELISRLRKLPIGYNLLTFLFVSKDEKLKKKVLGNTKGKESLIDLMPDYQIDKTLPRNIRVFRGLTLRYRAHPYYRVVHKEIHKIKSFKRYWHDAFREDENQNQDILTYHHRKLGLISYMATVSTITTMYGELYLLTYVPMDLKTLNDFVYLANQETEKVKRLAKWPDKELK